MPGLPARIQARELRGRHRQAEVVALQLVATVGDEPGCLRGRFDALGDRAALQLRRQADDGARDAVKMGWRQTKFAGIGRGWPVRAVVLLQERLEALNPLFVFAIGRIVPLVACLVETRRQRQGRGQIGIQGRRDCCGWFPIPWPGG